jgi:hypothetical protein
MDDIWSERHEARKFAEWAAIGYHAYEAGFLRNHHFNAPDDECVKAWLDGWDAAYHDHMGGPDD